MAVAPAGGHEEVITMEVLVTVKLPSVRNRYGFLNRNSTKEDVLVQQTALRNNNAGKYLHSARRGKTGV